MSLSRRGLFGGFLGAAVVAKIAPVQAASPPIAPPAKFPRGTVLPRHHFVPGHTHGFASHGNTQAVAVIEYEIFDGSAFVPLNSDAGQRVVRELS
jgi:hypothetical protein